MKQEDKEDILYQLEDPEAETSDNAGKQGEPDDEGDKKKGNLFLIMFKILISPVEGWKSLRRLHLKPEAMGSRCFYPMLAIAAAAVFCSSMFISGMEVTEAVTGALIVFISFFFGYFLIQLLTGILLPRETAEEMKSDHAKNFVMMNLSTLALFYTVYTLLPFIDPVLVFLPIWTIYIICRGMRFFHVPPQREVAVTTILCLLILGIPSLCGWCFSEIL